MDKLIEPLLNYGALGIFAALLVYFARSLLLREQKRADDSAAEVTRLNTLMQEKTIPALIAATQAVATAQTVLQGIKYQQDVEAASAAKVRTP